MLGLISFLLFISLSISYSSESIFVKINCGDKTLSLIKGKNLVKKYKCTFGQGGVKLKTKRGDKITPLGKYYVVDIRSSSKYHYFIHLSYPNSKDAKRAFDKGIISKKQYLSIIEAEKNKALPPQNTPLGGSIGIHGIKKGFAWLGFLHRFKNWTKGCIAVTNEEIEEIVKIVKVGTIVVIE